MPICVGASEKDYKYTGSHWILFVADVLQQTISILNSIPGYCPDEETTLFSRWRYEDEQLKTKNVRKFY